MVEAVEALRPPEASPDAKVFGLNDRQIARRVGAVAKHLERRQTQARTRRS